MTARVLIVSPVRNEAGHIERVAAGVAAQELEPARWIVIDDGSRDDTLARLRRLERQMPFMTVLSASEAPVPAGRDRLAAAAAPRNFNAGLAHADLREFTHVMKLDGDIELPPHYLRLLLERFAGRPQLGLAGGVLVEPEQDGRQRPIRIPRNHVHGAVKLYSRECFEAIGGVRECLGWDTIDEIYARMRGYEARSFTDLVSVHHRPLGTADGALRGRARHGTCAYIVHLPLGWVVLRSLKVGLRYRPYGLSGVAFLHGYARGAWQRIERVEDPEYRRFTRAEIRAREIELLRSAPFAIARRLTRLLRNRPTRRRSAASVASVDGSADHR